MDLLLYPILFLFFIPVLSEWVSEPAPGFSKSYSESKLENCAALQGTAKDSVSSNISNGSARTRYIETFRVHCKPWLLGPGVRDNRDDLLLSRLSAETARITSRLSAVEGQRRWGSQSNSFWAVKTLGFSSALSGKIRLAFETVLATQGRVLMFNLQPVPDEFADHVSQRLAGYAVARQFDSNWGRVNEELSESLWNDENWEIGERGFSQRLTRAEDILTVTCAQPKEYSEIFIIDVAPQSSRLFAAVCTQGRFGWLL